MVSSLENIAMIYLDSDNHGIEIIMVASDGLDLLVYMLMKGCKTYKKEIPFNNIIPEKSKLRSGNTSKISSLPKFQISRI